jgi:hypothetical protein
MDARTEFAVLGKWKKLQPEMTKFEVNLGIFALDPKVVISWLIHFSLFRSSFHAVRNATGCLWRSA